LEEIKEYKNQTESKKIQIIEMFQNVDLEILKEDKKEFVKAALSPAKVESVEILDDDETARVIVKKDQLSLAIGKAGQNARLAAKLTGMRVDIKTLEDLLAAEEEAKLSEVQDVEETVEGENE